MLPRASSCRFDPLHAVSRGGGHHPIHQLIGDGRHVARHASFIASARGIRPAQNDGRS